MAAVPGPAEPGRDGRLAAGARGPPAVRGTRWPRCSLASPGRWPGRSTWPTSARSTCGWPSPGCPSWTSPRATPRSPGCASCAAAGPTSATRDNRAEAEERLQRELAVIEEKDFPGYFLIVHDMVKFARDRGILCQGRGSAANSVVCYVLGVTAVDPIKFQLPFERFLSASRDEEPDIDVDFDSDRREEVIQEVYRRYGRHNAAQVANVISYRPKSAVRDMAKALGYSTGQQDAWSKQIDTWGVGPGRRGPRHPAAGGRPGRPADEGPAAPGHPLRRHGADRAAGGGGVPDRAGPDGRPHRAAVGQGQLRLDGAGQVRLPRAGHPGRDPVHLRPGRRTGSGSGGPSTPCPRRSRASTTCSAGPTRSGSSRSRAGPRSAPCPGCSRAGSTTWWSRSR